MKPRAGFSFDHHARNAFRIHSRLSCPHSKRPPRIPDCPHPISGPVVEPFHECPSISSVCAAIWSIAGDPASRSMIVRPGNPQRFRRRYRIIRKTAERMTAQKMARNAHDFQQRMPARIDRGRPCASTVFVARVQIFVTPNALERNPTFGCVLVRFDPRSTSGMLAARGLRTRFAGLKKMRTT